MRLLHLRALPTALITASILLPASAAPAQEAETRSRAPSAIEEITVTAEKREESLQDTALSIQAFGADELERTGMDATEDIGAFTPGFKFVPATGSNSQVAFLGRGTGVTDNHPIKEQTVGLYIDGVYHGTGESALFELMDIERIEVLKGPQGTLFGRNTTGGAISIVTRKPSPELGGSVKVGLGQDGYWGVQGGIDLPLSDETLLSRISFMRHVRDPFTKNTAPAGVKPGILAPGPDDFDDQDAWGVRGAFRLIASDVLTIDYSVDRIEHDQRTPAFANTSFNPFIRFITESGADPSRWLETDNGDIANDGGNWDRMKVWHHTLTAAWELSEDLTLKSINGYRAYDGNRRSDLDGFPIKSGAVQGTEGLAHYGNIVETDVFYHELQLVGSLFDQRLEFAAGGTYLDDESDYTNLGETAFGGANGNYIREVLGDNSSWGLYGQATYHITERLDFTGGLRYTSEDREAAYTSCDIALPSSLLLTIGVRACPDGNRNPVLWGVKRSDSFSALTPMARFSYHLNDDVMTYLSWTQGYRSGGFPNRPAANLQATRAFEEEYVTQWEAGIKSSFWDNRLQLNASAYYSDLDDQQVDRALFAESGTVTLTENAGQSRIRGFEIEARAVPIEGLELRLTHAYTNVDFAEFITYRGGQNVNIADERCFCIQPKRTYSGWVSYTFPSSGIGTFQVMANFQRQGAHGYNSTKSSAALVWQNAYTVYGLRAKLYDAFGVDGLGLNLIGRNITDTVYTVNGINFFYWQGYNYGDPSHWTFEVEYEF